MTNEQLKAFRAHGFSLEDVIEDSNDNEEYIWIKVPSLARYGLDDIRLSKEEANGIQDVFSRMLDSL